MVALDDPRRLLARVAQRVLQGGHPVPPERILARYPRTMALLAQAVQLADVAYLYDAVDVDGTTDSGGPRLVAVRSGAKVIEPAGALPAWARTMLSHSPPGRGAAA